MRLRQGEEAETCHFEPLPHWKVHMPFTLTSQPSNKRALRFHVTYTPALTFKCSLCAMMVVDRWLANNLGAKEMLAFDAEQHSPSKTLLDNETLLSGHFWGELRVFLAVAKAKSLNRAAELLNSSQPTVSRQVKRLQDVIGSPLFITTPQGVKLTAAGEELALGLAKLDHFLFSLTNAGRSARKSGPLRNDQDEKATRGETLVPDHIGERLAELAALARRANLNILACLLELAGTEAGRASRWIIDDEHQ
jgi:hypothetical protein